MSDIEGSDAPVVKGFKGKEKEVEGQAKREGKVTVGAMCRRRLAVVLVRLKMAETVKMVSLDLPGPLIGGEKLIAELSDRLSLTLSKVTSAWDQTRSLILHSSSHGIWRTLSPGSIPPSSSVTSRSTT